MHGKGDIFDFEKMGEAPGDGLVCDGGNVSLDFPSRRPKAQTQSPESEPLIRVAIPKIGYCW
jgi:hypothetical protein